MEIEIKEMKVASVGTEPDNPNVIPGALCLGLGLVCAGAGGFCLGGGVFCGIIC